MMIEKLNPATLAAGRALENVFSLAANSPETTEDASKIQEHRAAFIARKFRMSRDIAETVAPLAFGEARV